MNSQIAATPRKSFRFSRAQSIGLVFCCTICGTIAQMLIKIGANNLGPNTSPIAMLMNVPLVVGYGFYGISVVLLTLALRDGELSILYPVISLTYVWVTILSFLVFKESFSIFKVLGVAIIVCGVAILGIDKRR